MELEELRRRVLLKAFKSTGCGQVYRFLQDNVLSVNTETGNYNISIDKNWFVLEHSNLIGTEKLVIEVETLLYPMTLTLFKRSNLEFFTTFIEE